jgi:hypothetical protein
MKIENFTLNMSSEHTKTFSVSRGFATELDAENIKRVQEDKALNKEVHLCKRLEFALIEQLIYALESRLYRFEKLDVPQFEKRDNGFYERRVASESLKVSMNGFIKTATQTTAITMDVSFSHTFVQEHAIDKKQFYDPLVINFNDELPNLVNKHFDFDIDSDGVSEQISLLQNGNGFLSLDTNGNNIIDDGSELFGTKNGNGFADLSRFDSDNNGWIDANDPILEKLRIWIRNENENRLVALGELGIGALYLGYTTNPFDIKNDANETLGRIRSNGLYLNENGSSGLLTQIDFARHNKKAGRKLNISDLQQLLKAV